MTTNRAKKQAARHAARESGLNYTATLRQSQSPLGAAKTPDVAWAELYAAGGLLLTLRDGSLGNPGCDECGENDAVVRIDGTYLCLASLVSPEWQSRLALWRAGADPAESSDFCDECGAAIRGYDGLSYTHERSCSMYPGNVAGPATCILLGQPGENADDCTTHDHEAPVQGRRCGECDRPLSVNEENLLAHDTDFIEHHGHTIRAVVDSSPLNAAPNSSGAALPTGVRAEAHDDDFAFTIEFDATAYLEAASTAEIIALAECGWRGDYPADAVAQFAAEGNSALAAMFEYCARRQVGFECAVDPDTALEWLKTNRPVVFLGLGASGGSSVPLLSFFEVELGNELQMWREGGSPPASTLSTALDSWEQAPDDVRVSWCKWTPIGPGAGEQLVAFIGDELRTLIETLGPDTLLDGLVA